MSRFKRLIVEAHQRSLWQALVIYLGASYAVLEAVALFRDEFGLPDWLLPVALVLLLTGLPVVVLTSLAKGEVYGDEVPVEHAAAAAEEDRRLKLLTWRTAGFSFMAAMALWGVVAAGLLLFGGYARPPGVARPSLAVLPFDNLSPDPNNAYFADGVHEEIIGQLGKIAGLRVISRTSVMEYRGQTRNLREIADELGVANVLEGSVRRAGDRVRITTQLLNAKQDEHLWADSYERDLGDAFAIQADVAQQVASALEAVLTPEERVRIETRPTESNEAYDFYLRGNEYARQRYDPTGLLISVRMYQRAIELDSAFAIAYAALARWQGWRSWYYGVPEVLPEAREMLERARELGPDLPEVHMAQGVFHYREREYSEAIQAFARTRELQPNNGEAIAYVGWVRRRQGRWQEAISKQQEALQLDPRNHVWIYDLAFSYTYTRQYDEAEANINRAIALAPDVAEYYVVKALHRLLWNGNTDRAIEVIHEGFEAARHVEVISHVANLPEVGPHYQPLMRVLAAGYEEAPDEVALRESCLVCYFVLKSTVHRQRAEHDLAHAYYDSLRVTLAGSAERREGIYSEAQFWRYLGLAYAGLGQRDSAMAAGERSVSLLPVSDDAFVGSDLLRTLAEIYVMVGEYEAAVDRLEYLLSIPSNVSVPLLRVDPLYDPLRDHPRFQTVLEKYE